jgi:general secretion pathway protein J
MRLTSAIYREKANNRGGFTLLEILIALAIFAVIITTIYTSYTGTFRVIDETESQTEIYRIARIAMERMLEDLESVYIPKNIEDSQSEDDTIESFQFLGEDRSIKGKNADILRFVSRAVVSLSDQERDTGISEIIYYVKENIEEGDLVLYRGDKPMFQQVSDIEDESGLLVLCERLESVSFTYYDENNEVLKDWDSTSIDLKNKLPKMISIALEFANISSPENPIKFTTNLSLPIEQEYL